MAGWRNGARQVDRALVALALVYFAALVLILVWPGLFGGIDPGDVASMPLSVARGQLERLLSSGLVVDGDLPLAQIAVAAAIAALVVARHGIRAWWGAALSGHVGSALVAYAVIAVALAAGWAQAERVTDRRDFGISCVVAGTVGALFAGALLRIRDGSGTRADRLIAAAALAAFLVVLPFSFDWYAIEHPVAFALGAGFLLLTARRRVLSPRPSAAAGRGSARPPAG